MERDMIWGNEPQYNTQMVSYKLYSLNLYNFIDQYNPNTFNNNKKKLPLPQV